MGDLGYMGWVMGAGKMIKWSMMWLLITTTWLASYFIKTWSKSVWSKHNYETDNAKLTTNLTANQNINICCDMQYCQLLTIYPVHPWPLAIYSCMAFYYFGSVFKINCQVITYIAINCFLEQMPPSSPL